MTVAKVYPGVYYINKETFVTQIIVTKELPPKDNIYLHLGNSTKGEEDMFICEGLLNLCGTSSEEIIERTKKEDAEYYQPMIDSLSSQIDYLKSLLIQHDIPFGL